MRIDGTTFGSITIDGVTYDHDVVVHLSGDIVKRKKKLSKREYGTSHIVSKKEIKTVYEKGCSRMIVGTGQTDMLRLSDEAAAYLARKGCAVFAAPTPSAVDTFNSTAGQKIGLFHVTC